MTTTPRFPIRLFLAAALLLSPCHLLADEKVKPEQEEQPEFIGLWESKKGSIYIEFTEDGKFHIVPRDGAPKVGTWKKNPESGELSVVGTVWGEKFDGKLEVKMDGENAASFTIEDDTVACTRIKKKLDRKKLIGTWKSTEEDDELLSHYLVIQREDGTGTFKSLEIHKGNKTYCTSADEFEWRVVGDRLLEISEAGTENEWATVFGNFKFDGDKISYDMLEGDDFTIVEFKDDRAELPDPPKGHKKVPHEDFWDAILEAGLPDGAIPAPEVLEGD